MKLKFRILEIPEDKLNNYNPSHDNIALVYDEKYLSFLWDQYWLKTTDANGHVLYILKKIG